MQQRLLNMVSQRKKARFSQSSIWQLVSGLIAVMTKVDRLEVRGLDYSKKLTFLANAVAGSKKASAASCIEILSVPSVLIVFARELLLL